MLENQPQVLTTPAAEANAFVGEDGRLRSGWRVAAFFFGFVIVQVGCQIAFSVTLVLGLMMSMGEEGLEMAATIEQRPEVHFVSAVVTLPLLMVLMWFFRRYLDKRTFRSLGFWWDRTAAFDLPLGLLMGAGLIGASALLAIAAGLYAWGAPAASPSALLLAGEMSLMVVGLLAAALIEEIVCRAYMQRNLTESIGPVWSIAIVSAVFALLHGANPNVTGLALINLFGAGVLLGLVYHRFRSIWAVWTMHFAWNFTMGPVLGVPVSGMKTARIFELTLIDPLLAQWQDWWAVSGGPFGFEGGLVSTGVMALCITVLWLWKGRAARPAEAHPEYLWKMEQCRLAKERARLVAQASRPGPSGAMTDRGQ